MQDFASGGGEGGLRPVAKGGPLKCQHKGRSAIILYSHYGFRSPDNLSRDLQAGKLFPGRAETVSFTTRGKRADSPARAGVRAKTVRSRRQDREIDGGGGSADCLREPAAEFEGRIAARRFRSIQLAARNIADWSERSHLPVRAAGFVRGLSPAISRSADQHLPEFQPQGYRENRRWLGGR